MLEVRVRLVARLGVGFGPQGALKGDTLLEAA
jgi:hypothetical protein